MGFLFFFPDFQSPFLLTSSFFHQTSAIFFLHKACDYKNFQIIDDNINEKLYLCKKQ